ncbi:MULTISPECIES: nitroreductase family protein [Komagataeibacter]|uniref:Nitroreductase family protein n=1 Tax=Komagataeibacter saccharivorans TaxID=265959 RepID=A0A347WGB9_9PROT|nr:nitroreductase family protein [Komagataeibacter saccharivorans]MBL7236962.1 nitroreductase family protein [Novacetimonas hansenii]AXY23912.1 Nitroreductase family protein [Komagataeibacter saccharivorans]PYD50875.1 nitroreductase [Komagataeibacter saccharivorans]QBL95102.1 hypothetical protein KSAC_29230 [Komagataeibacter saccharivorans]GBQ40731.1 nitroreductase [Komagataeibacter saccharivorans NRIC 0614]
MNRTATTSSASRRKTRTGTHDLFLARWSPRAFEPVEIERDTLLSFLEAGRWAPSAYNFQPWRFIHARRDTPQWETFGQWLLPFNRAWAQNASALVYVVSRTTIVPPGKTEAVPSPSHAFDAGAAALLIQLQAAHEGWASHVMGGINRDAAHAGLGLPDDYTVEAAIAIGRRAHPDGLPAHLADREFPSDRLPLDEIAFEGRFPAASEPV